jgi:hypothetical protein
MGHPAKCGFVGRKGWNVVVVRNSSGSFDFASRGEAARGFAQDDGNQQMSLMATISGGLMYCFLRGKFPMMQATKFAAVLWIAALIAMGTMQAQQGGNQPQATNKTQAATLTISADKVVAKVSPTLYGLMTEEINYSYEGGLYGELVQNRTFRSDWSGVNEWIVTPYGSARGSVAMDKTTGPSAVLSTSLKVTVEQADAKDAYGLRNGGWWGVPVRANTMRRRWVARRCG